MRRIARIPRRRHLHRHPRDDPRDDVGVRVGVIAVECQFIATELSRTEVKRHQNTFQALPAIRAARRWLHSTRKLVSYYVF